MTLKEKINAVYETAEDCNGEVRDNYSGRGMMGESCYGIVCGDPGACIEAAAQHGLRGARTDDMGRESIVYWESIVGKN